MADREHKSTLARGHDGRVSSDGGCRRIFGLALAVSVLAALGAAGCRPPEVLIAQGASASMTSPTTLASAVTLVNQSDEAVRDILVTRISLTGGTLAVPALPLHLGPIAAGESVPLHATFIGRFTAEGRHRFTVEGFFEVGHDRKRFTFDTVVVIPPRSPGKGTLQSVAVHAGRVFGAPFPARRPGFDREVNTLRWTVPTGLPVAGTPRPKGTEVTRAPMIPPRAPEPDDPPAIVFEANHSMGLTSAAAGTVSTIAEPSGASNGRDVVFSTANWVAAYSTDGGGSFTQLDPTKIFPPDAVGYCCDQVVQYVRSIDRFVWILQGSNGNGYRLASASPRDIVTSSGTAWTYWNLTPQLFGQPGGTALDYPDLSVGDHFLYMSWDAGAPGCPPGCRSGFQVVRASLDEILAGGTLTLEFTDPPDAPMAWGSHLTQDPGNEIFWAGHNTTSSMRVFSLAEGSGTYFWRDVTISSWPNNALSSITPDGFNWVAGSSGFPGNAILGSTRVGRQLWFAWTAGTDQRFQQPHVELAVLDRNNGFNVLQRQQIWNNSYGFAYPALATNACTGEVGLSLEYGGPSDFENHVVGFWGDFVLYVTTDSNVGTSRFGDYVTIRQRPATRHHPGNLFDAFGYGLDAPSPPATGTQADVHHVVFGRPSCR
ncbi:MAG TPA: hypothetical protein VF516_34975 [Kofleriaceae bacterium]